jgi:DNA helicase HerA-like ATPase
MSNRKTQFQEIITKGYACSGESILLGTAILDGEALPSTHILVPLKTLNRHGLIAGATGTGKTKTLQILTERLSEKGVPCLVMDVKGDLSGIAIPGVSNEKIKERQSKIGDEYDPSGSPVEFLSLSNEPGVKLRATVSEFGPILFSKILELNDTQSSLVTILFKYCDDKKWPLLDLKDFKKLIQFATEAGKKEMEADYGKISESSLSIILRKIVELESQGGEEFFGEPSFEVEDLVRLDKNKKGIVSILRLTDIQDKPKLFSTFMLCLLAEIYATFPESGDLAKPKLVIFIDEAHLIFSEASKALLNQIETIVKLIRSKGVGVFFCTQSPGDVPESVLGQLGLKIQHALRAFTAKDRKEIKLTAQNYPLSDYYNTEDALTSLGMGEALVTVLNEKGSPTPLASTLLVAPKSRMDVLTEKEIDSILSESSILQAYSKPMDRESAYEILNEMMNAKEESEDKTSETSAKNSDSGSRNAKEEKSTLEKVTESAAGKIVIREVTRGLLGVLGLKSTRTTRKKKGLFF